MAGSIITSLKKTQAASFILQAASDAQLKRTLIALASEVENSTSIILKANAKDLAKQDASNPKLDRLMLNEQRIKAIADSIRNVSKLPNPSNKINTEKWFAIAAYCGATGRCRRYL